MKTLRAYLRQPRHFELVEEDLYPNDDQILVKMQLELGIYFIKCAL